MSTGKVTNVKKHCFELLQTMHKQQSHLLEEITDLIAYDKFQ